MEILDWPFRGTDALAAKAINRHRLRTDFEMVHRNVYIRRGQKLTPVTRAVAAWLWSERTATVAGLSAAALHRAAWIDDWLPAELNRPSRDKARGIILHSDSLDDDETCVRDGIRMTTPARTAFDLGRRKGLTAAVIRLDALMHASELKAADVELIADRHRGARGLVQLRRVLHLADAGAESPYETKTRLVLVGGGLPRSQTQIEVLNEWAAVVARIDMTGRSGRSASNSTARNIGPILRGVPGTSIDWPSSMPGAGGSSGSAPTCSDTDPMSWLRAPEVRCWRPVARYDPPNVELMRKNAARCAQSSRRSAVGP